MGYATIVSGGTDGRYVIQVDTGESLRLAILAAITEVINRQEIRVSQAQVKVDEADAAEAALVAQFNALVSTMDGPLFGPQQGANMSALAGVRKLILLTRVRAYPLRLALDVAKFDLAQSRKLAASMNTVQTLTTKNAWCTDFTEDAEPGDIVATIDIPGDTNLQLIAPSARAWSAADGQIIERALLSPAQAYLTASIFPGWQKFKPTYRWGTITALSTEDDTATVALFAQTSSAQRLGVNQSSTLENVPIEYMTCNAQAFEVDDRVVVQFVGQDWDNPRIIGFLDNPRSCDLECFHLVVDQYCFQVRSVSLMSALFGGGVTFEAKLNGGAWETMTVSGATQTSSYLQYELRFDNYFGPTDGTIFVSANRYGIELPAVLGGAPPFISVLVSPSGPYPPARDFEDVNIAEVRIKIVGVVVFNAAVRDMGWVGEGITTGYAKSRNGIRLQSFPNSVGTQVLPLEYTLTGGT